MVFRCEKSEITYPCSKAHENLCYTYSIEQKLFILCVQNIFQCDSVRQATTKSKSIYRKQYLQCVPCVIYVSNVKVYRSFLSSLQLPLHLAPGNEYVVFRTFIKYLCLFFLRLYVDVDIHQPPHSIEILVVRLSVSSLLFFSNRQLSSLCECSQLGSNNSKQHISHTFFSPMNKLFREIPMAIF